MGVDTLKVHIPGMHLIRPVIKSESGLWQGRNLRSGLQITVHVSHGATGKTWAAADLVKLHAAIRQVARESANFVCGGSYEFMFRQILGGSIAVLDLTMDLSAALSETAVVAPNTSFPDMRWKEFPSKDGVNPPSRTCYWGHESYTGQDGAYHPATARELKLYNKTHQMKDVRDTDIEREITRLEMTLNRNDTVSRHMGVATVADLLNLRAREFKLRIATCFEELQIVVRGEGVKPLTHRQKKEIRARGGIMERKLRRFENRTKRQEKARQKQYQNAGQPVGKTKEKTLGICLFIREERISETENNTNRYGSGFSEPGTVYKCAPTPWPDCINPGGNPLSEEEKKDIEEILEILREGIVEEIDLPDVA